MDETGDAFAGGKWPEIDCFVGAQVSAVSFRGSDPPALVSSVSDEAADRRFVAAVASIGAKKFALQRASSGPSAKKFALLAKKALILGSFGGAGRTFSRVGADGAEQGEFCRACGAGVELE